MPRWPMFWTWPPVQPTNKRRVTFTFKAKIASDVARAGIEPATFRFSGGRSYQLSYLAGRHRVSNRSASPLDGDPDGT